MADNTSERAATSDILTRPPPAGLLKRLGLEHLVDVALPTPVIGGEQAV